MTTSPMTRLPRTRSRVEHPKISSRFAQPRTPPPGGMPDEGSEGGRSDLIGSSGESVARLTQDRNGAILAQRQE
jgi:hypothetical protein